MYNTLLRMWKNGMLDEAAIDKAVTLKWITTEEAEKIKATPQK